MKRAVLLCALLLSAAGYVFLQTNAPSRKLATVMPSGALLYLEAPDFGRLLHEWDTSKMKSDWLGSANYAVFSRSNLFPKLQEVFNQYGEAAGFLPDLKSLMEIAGTDSALALYDIREIQFLYVSRVGDADLLKSQLWAVRDKFEQRQAGGVSFYLRTDAASNRTVAFAFVKGYLLLATRDDLVAQALELLAGGSNPSLASDRWYRDATAATSTRGEMRLVMNLESLVKSVAFRSYWVQRNVSTIRPYWAGIADVQRTAGAVTESRVFLRSPDAKEVMPAADAALSGLLPLVPPEAGLYKAVRVGEPSEAAELIVRKLIGPQTQHSRDWRDAPVAISPDSVAGNEGDLETRIDEQPLPADSGISDSVAAARALVDKAGARALLLVQSSAAGTFVQTPCVVVLEEEQDWDRDQVRSSLTNVAGKLWTTSQLGAGWVTGTTGRHSIERLNGLGPLLFANRGRFLFLSNDSRLLAAVLDRAGAPPATGTFTYAAGFRHVRERSNYDRLMAALDFTSPAENVGFGLADRGDSTPAFFSGNIAGLSRVLSGVTEVRLMEEERGAVTVQTVLYQMAQ